MQMNSARSVVLRIVAVILFILAGPYLAFVGALGAPSFWYASCFYALPLISVLWA